MAYELSKVSFIEKSSFIFSSELLFLLSTLLLKFVALWSLQFKKTDGTALGFNYLLSGTSICKDCLN